MLNIKTLAIPLALAAALSQPVSAHHGWSEYDSSKELKLTGTYESGMTHPHVYWRWTRQRNRRAFLRLLASGQLQLGPLLTHVVSHRSSIARKW